VGFYCRWSSFFCHSVSNRIAQRQTAAHLAVWRCNNQNTLTSQSVSPRSKGVGTLVQPYGTTLVPCSVRLAEKRPKNRMKNTSFFKALELNARSLAIWWDSQWQYEWRLHIFRFGICVATLTGIYEIDCSLTSYSTSVWAVGAWDHSRSLCCSFFQLSKIRIERQNSSWIILRKEAANGYYDTHTLTWASEIPVNQSVHQQQLLVLAKSQKTM
jgi:hypothetical protein